MFIKKEEKAQMQEQIAMLVEDSEKQTKTIEKLLEQNSLLKQAQDSQISSFNTQIAILDEAKTQQLEMLKILSEQNAELQKTNKNMIEQRDKNEAVLIEAVGKIADVKKYTTAIYTEEQKKKAAYALNLCMVSISQIVDYNDLYVLDQEYEMILNNLNLENMPKDEALLNILKQTLDTITYFRIQEGDRRFIEKEYQHNVKNALWSSVPRNLNILTCGESPWAIVISAALSLTCQVGTGYMNYRRNRANYSITREKQNWELQKSAMEQFNGLRRDLFDTAWRLADEYNFADELRLTERQIDLYNSILDDNDDMRKYERLSIISGAFDAYPPFWFFIGDAAARIATNQSNLELKSKFKYLAISHFDKYIEMSKSNLLRENILLSTCALEYIDLLDPDKDIERILSLLELATKNAGNENDIIELIGIAYMKIGNTECASNEFRRLINEGYNVGINVQLLSSLYVQEYLSNPEPKRKHEIEELYLTLISRTRGNDTFRLPVNTNEDWNAINTEFVTTQQDRIIEQFNRMVEELEKKYNILYNKLIPLDLKKTREYGDNWYLDSDGSLENTQTERRLAEIAKNIKKDDRFAILCLKYSEESFSEQALDILSSLANCVAKYLSLVIGLDDSEEEAIVERNSSLKYDLADYLKDGISKNASAFKYIDDAFEHRDPQEQFMTAVKDANYKDITGDYYSELLRRGEESIRNTYNMSDLFNFESSIRALCVDQGIRINSRMSIDSGEDANNVEIPLSVIYGEKAQSKIEDKLEGLNKKRELLLIIKDYEKDMILNPNEVMLYTEKSDINLYISKSQLLKKLSRTNIIAILDDVGKRNRDLIFTLEGLYIIGNDHYVSSGEVFEYQNTLYNKTNVITFVRKGRVTHKQKYSNPNINVERMNAMILDMVSVLKGK